MFIYSKNVTIEATGTEPTKTVTRLFGTTKNIPDRENDKELVYKDASGEVIDATTMDEFKFFYNHDGVYANDSTRQIPNFAEDTNVNVFIEDENDVLYPVFAKTYTVTLNVTNGSAEPTFAKVVVGGSAEFALTAESSYTVPTSATIDPTTAGTVTIASDTLTVSGVSEDAVVEVVCEEE